MRDRNQYEIMYDSGKRVILKILLFVSSFLYTSGLYAKTQWYKYFHLGEIADFSRKAEKMSVSKA